MRGVDGLFTVSRSVTSEVEVERLLDPALAEGSSGQLNFNTAGNRLGSVWKSLKAPARAAILLIIGLTVLVILWLAGGSIIPIPMEVLFHRLEPHQAREVVLMLEEQGIAYNITDGGSTILVPRDQRDRLRLTISPDLYAQGAGFALFEGNGLVASDYTRRVQWQIALEEELRRTISSIEAVDQARVHLVIPEGSLFVREQGSPSASVFLRLMPMAVLSGEQVRGILSLVAGSVEGLRPENVNIVDSQGNILYDAFAAIDDLPLSGSVQSRLKLKRQFERELENRLKAVLDQVYGPGRALAMVSAELDFDARETTTVTYDDQLVERSTQRVEERSEGTAPPSGEVGEPNIPGYEGTGGQGEYSFERIEEIVNYEISETRETVAAAPGRVLRLSTAVVIDNSEAGAIAGDQVSALVESALGLDEERGDTLSVQLMPFDLTWREGWEEAPDTVIPPITRNLYLYAAAGFVVLMIIFVAVFLSRRSRRRAREHERVFTEKSTAPETTAAPAPSQEERWQKQARQLAEEVPAGVASLIKTWLVEE